MRELDHPAGALVVDEARKRFEMARATFRILLAENDQDLLYVTTELLRVEGYGVKTATIGAAALRLGAYLRPPRRYHASRAA